MTKQTYKEKLLDPRWQKKRLLILQRDDFACKLCEDQSTTLHIHHKTYKIGADPWDYKNCDLVTLCEHCHKEITELGDVEFNDVKIFKSKNWKGGSRIMFIITSTKILMRIYDGDNTFVIGYNLGDEAMKIIGILKVGIKKVFKIKRYPKTYPKG